MVGSKIIDRALSLITKGELKKATTMMDTGSLWSCHAWIAAAFQNKLK